MGNASETIVFNGIKFRRYPKASGWAERSYFTPGIADKQRGVRRLHEELWMHANGVSSIPAGHHIHHIDHNPSNNDPSNLQAIPASDHAAHHGEQPRSERQRDHWYGKCLPAAAKWHGTAQGIEWHRQHGAAAWEGREYRRESCEQCGSAYSTRQVQRTDRFCSNACKSAWRRAAGLDDEDRTCIQCGEVFRINRYSKTRCCSRSCAARQRWERRRSLQPGGS